MFHTNKTKNPTIQELQNNDDFELIAELSHSQIKDFIINQISEGGRIIKIYMIYQALMILIGIFFLTRSLVLAFGGNVSPLLFTLTGLLITLSLLIIIHELLHGLALILAGARRVNFGAYPRKFIFYAEADRQVLNRRQFTFVALTPLFAVKIISLAAIIMYADHPFFYLPVFLMSAHSLFCAGDIGILSLFYRYRDSEIYSYDVKAEKKSYFYRKKIIQAHH